MGMEKLQDKLTQKFFRKISSWKVSENLQNSHSVRSTEKSFFYESHLYKYGEKASLLAIQCITKMIIMSFSYYGSEQVQIKRVMKKIDKGNSKLI